MWDRLSDCGARIIFGLIVFAVLATAILLQAPKWLADFDQSFYLTIAYDLNHHGTFSNGVFDEVNSALAAPPPGKFFAPVYPWLIVAATKLDDRFASAADCVVEANEKVRDGAECEVYAVPMHMMHAALLTLDLSLQLQRYPRASDQRGAETSKRMPRSQRKVVQDRI